MRNSRNSGLDGRLANARPSRCKATVRALMLVQFYARRKSRETAKEGLMLEPCRSVIYGPAENVIATR